jgi:hypothetical protein
MNGTWLQHAHIDTHTPLAALVHSLPILQSWLYTHSLVTSRRPVNIISQMRKPTRQHIPLAARAHPANSCVLSIPLLLIG